MSASAAKVVIYTRSGCSYCVRALGLLTRKGAVFEHIDATHDATKRAEMMRLSGRSTFPQIFINGQHVGGCDDLHDLDAAGRLDPMLAAA